MKAIPSFTILFLIFCATGCGGDEPQFPQLEGDWILEGLRCQGELETRLVRFSDRGEGLVGRYLREDECLERGDEIWSTHPEADDDEVDLLVRSETQERTTYRVERAADHALRLLSPDEGRDLTMRRAAPDDSPQRTAEEGVNLGGMWWMDGFLCDEMEIPQLVSVTNPPRLLTITKIEGDECVGENQPFFDGSIDEFRLEGDFDIFERDPFAEHEALEVAGEIRTKDYFYLNVLGQRVVFRRILADSL